MAFLKWNTCRRQDRYFW